MPGVALSFPPEPLLRLSGYYLLWQISGNRMTNL
jgi:hypothetical protein